MKCKSVMTFKAQKTYTNMKKGLDGMDEGFYLRSLVKSTEYDTVLFFGYYISGTYVTMNVFPNKRPNGLFDCVIAFEI